MSEQAVPAKAAHSVPPSVHMGGNPCALAESAQKAPMPKVSMHTVPAGHCTAIWPGGVQANRQPMTPEASKQLVPANASHSVPPTVQAGMAMLPGQRHTAPVPVGLAQSNPAGQPSSPAAAGSLPHSATAGSVVPAAIVPAGAAAVVPAAAAGTPAIVPAAGAAAVAPAGAPAAGAAAVAPAIVWSRRPLVAPSSLHPSAVAKTSATIVCIRACNVIAFTSVPSPSSHRGGVLDVRCNSVHGSPSLNLQSPGCACPDLGTDGKERWPTRRSCNGSRDFGRPRGRVNGSSSSPDRPT